MLDHRSCHVRGRQWRSVLKSTSIITSAMALVALPALAPVHAAKPYMPREGDEVLEKLPTALFGARDEVAELRRKLAANPKAPDLAGSLAARYMALGGQTGDARYYGYARAAIGAWWESENPPADILKLRAKLKERNHDYDPALADLHLLLRIDPLDVQAGIEVANINRVQGKYDEANQACDRLNRFAGPFATALGRIPILAVTGHANDAYAQLERMLPDARVQFPATVQWFLTMQADIAVALGRDAEAEAHLREGLALAPEDKYLLRAYGDFLLDHGRDQEALSLVEGHAIDDGLLLCSAIAAQRLGKAERAAEWKAQLQSRFDEVRQRGDQPLGRFESLYELELKHDPERALKLALANWHVQKETHDTQAVLKAAIAAHASAEAKPVLKFLAANHTEHAGIQKLVKQLESEGLADRQLAHD